MDISVYDTTTVVLKVKSGGALVDADATPTAVLKSEWPPDNAIDRNLVVTKTSTGTYSAPLIPSDTSLQRELRVEWTYVVSGVSVSRSDYINVVSYYNDADDLSEVVPDTATAAEVQEASRFAKFLIESVTGQKFDKQYQEFRVRGTDKPQIVLPDRIVSISTVYSDDTLKYDSSATDNDFSFSVTPTKYGLVFNVSDDIVRQIDSIQTWSSSKFFTFAGFFGWDYVPEEIKLAHKLLVNDWFCDQSKWKKSYISEQKSSDWQVKYSGKVFIDTGNFYVDQLLAPFVRQPWMVL